MEVPDPNHDPRPRASLSCLRATLLVLIVPTLIVLAYGAFSLQGHREDFPSKPMQTWPIGISSLILAAALSWAASRPSRGIQPIIVAICLASFAGAWATLLPQQLLER